MSDNGIWCTDCDADMPYLDGPHCPTCALPSPGGATCGRCLRKQPLFDRTVAACAYAFPLDQLIQSLKFREQLQLARELAERLVPRVTAIPDCLVPMPLHPARLRARGYNQSHELARHLSRRLAIPLLPHACRRVRDTSPQSALKSKDRMKNMRKAFQATHDFSGRHVAVVDDVMTSGASLNELALALRRSGAREISAWVIARALP